MTLIKSMAQSKIFAGRGTPSRRARPNSSWPCEYGPAQNALVGLAPESAARAHETSTYCLSRGNTGPVKGVKRHRVEPGHPVKRHRGEPGKKTPGEPGHTRDTRDTRPHKGPRTTQTNLTTIQTHQQHTPRTSARRPKPRLSRGRLNSRRPGADRSPRPTGNLLVRNDLFDSS